MPFSYSTDCFLIQPIVHQPVRHLIYRKATRRFYIDKRLDNYAGTTLKRAAADSGRPGRREFHGLPCLFYRCACPAAGRAALSGVCRPRADRRPFPACGLAFAGRAEECRDLVLERLSRHGPASESDRRHGRDRDPDGHRRRRHPQHRRQQSSAGRARARARRSAPQGSGAGFHLRLRLQRDRYLHAREADAELPDPFGCPEPQFDDRGRAPGAVREDTSSATTIWRISKSCWPPPIRSGRS